MPADLASTRSSATCPSGRRNSSATGPSGPKEKSLPPEQSFSRAQESHFRADTVVFQRSPSEIFNENGWSQRDAPPQRNYARIVRHFSGADRNGQPDNRGGARWE